MADASKPHQGNGQSEPNPEQGAKAITPRDAFAYAVPILRAAGLEDPVDEAGAIVRHFRRAKGWDGTLDRALFEAIVARRAAREPMAFITGKQGFWTLDLVVSPATLIPRPDSETLVEVAIKTLRPSWVKRVLDLGTGTGCLLLAVLHRFEDAFGVGVDISPAAASLAAANAKRYRPILGDRTAFLAGDWAASLTGTFELILCNPPYIETAAIAGLMPEVAAHEPLRALDGGPSGLDAYARLMPEVMRLLAPGGFAIFELGAGQQDGVLALARKAGLEPRDVRCDLGGVPRALVLCRPDGDKKPVGRSGVAR